MARARNIKPGFYKNEDLAECSVWARFIFPGLWMLADRDGLLEDRPKRIKAEILPFDGEDVEPLLAELAGRKLIVRYQNESGSFIWIPGFKRHQTPHYSEKPSGIKPPAFLESIRHEGEDAPGIDPDDSEKIPRGRGGRNPLNPDSLNPESLSSPPAADLPTPPTPIAAPLPPAVAVGLAGDQAVLDAGIAHIQAVHRLSFAASQQFVGNLCKLHDPDAVVDKLQRLLDSPTPIANPKAWLKAALEGDLRENTSRPGHIRSERDRVAAANPTVPDPALGHLF